MFSMPCSLVILLLLSNLVCADADADSSDETLGVVVLKLPRSGSSWLTTLLNSLDHAWIYPEFYHPSTVPPRDDAVVRFLQDGLQRRVLSAPVAHQRLSVTFSWADERNSSDKLVGYTLNPLYCCTEKKFSINGPYVPVRAVSEALRTVPNSRLLLFLRTNVVKQAVAVLEGSRIKEICGTPNVYHATAWHGDSRILPHANLFGPGDSLAERARRENCVKELRTSRLAVGLRRFRCVVSLQIWYVERLRRYAQHAQQGLAPGVPLVQLWYEALQTDPAGELRRALQELGASPAVLASVMKAVPPPFGASGGTGAIEKLGNEDLSQTFARQTFDALREEMQASSPNCLLPMLMANSSESFDIDCLQHLPLSWREPNACWFGNMAHFTPIDVV